MFFFTDFLLQGKCFSKKWLLMRNRGDTSRSKQDQVTSSKADNSHQHALRRIKLKGDDLTCSFVKKNKSLDRKNKVSSQKKLFGKWELIYKSPRNESGILWFEFNPESLPCFTNCSIFNTGDYSIFKVLFYMLVQNVYRTHVVNRDVQRILTCLKWVENSLAPAYFLVLSK